MNNLNVSMSIVLLAFGTLIIIACLRGAPGILYTSRFKGEGVSAHVQDTKLSSSAVGVLDAIDTSVVLGVADLAPIAISIVCARSANVYPVVPD